MKCKKPTASMAMIVLTAVCLAIATVSVSKFPLRNEPTIVDVVPTRQYSALLEYTKVAYVLRKRNIVQKRSWLREKA